MSDLTEKYDYRLKDDGPAAIIIKQWLKPVGDEIIFPPTYASSENEEDAGPRYNIDKFKDGSTCVIDSVPSQANRIEPAFTTIAEGKLVPQVFVVAEKTGEKRNLLDIGHRLADAAVRFSSLSKMVDEAFIARKAGDSLAIAKLAPTSLVFGAWDSRSTGVKLPRLVNSIIRAFDVEQNTRRAQYVAAFRDYEGAGVVQEAGDKRMSVVGLADVPAPVALGGITIRGGIRRDASLNLCTLRDITTGSAGDAIKLRRYVLGLALVAVTYFDNNTLNLRQGCQLVGVPDKPMSRKLINADGTEKEFPITKEDAVAYAMRSAEAFGVISEHRTDKFDASLAKKALKPDDKKKKGKKDQSIVEES
jgi:CRISPR-associated protein Csb1